MPLEIHLRRKRFCLYFDSKKEFQFRVADGDFGMKPFDSFITTRTGGKTQGKRRSSGSDPGKKVTQNMET